MERAAAWIATNGFQALQALGIVAGLFFTGISYRQNFRVQRAQTLITITQQHRSLWIKLFDLPKLRRVLSPKPMKGRAITFDESLFVNLLILHITSVLVAARERAIDLPAGMDADMKELFSFPIPRKVWEDSREFRDEATIRYIDSLLTPIES